MDASGPHDSVAAQAKAFRQSALQLRTEGQQKLQKAQDLDAQADTWEKAAKLLEPPKP